MLDPIASLARPRRRLLPRAALLPLLPLALALPACAVDAGDAGNAEQSGEATSTTHEALGGVPFLPINFTETGITSGVAAISQPSLVSTPTEVFWTDASHHLMWKHFDNKFRWQTARVASTGGVAVMGKPSAVVTDVNEWRVFVEGTDGSFWYVDYLGGDWRAPQMIGPPGTVMSGIDGVSVIYDWWTQYWRVYFVAPNGHVMETSHGGGPWWSGGRDTGAIATSAPSAVLRRSSGQVNVFYRGTNGDLFDVWFDGASWHAPWDHGIAMVGDPSGIAAPDDQRIAVYFSAPAAIRYGAPWPPTFRSHDWNSYAGWGSTASSHGITLNGAGAAGIEDIFGVSGGHLVEARPGML